MKTVIFLLVLAGIACAGRPPSPARPALADFELQPINHTGDETKQVRTGDTLISIGLAEHARIIKVVRVDHRPGGRKRDRRLVELFTPPTAIAGVPVPVFDYMIDPDPAVADADVPGRFTLVASGNTELELYTVTWVFTWNAARGTFDIAEPATTRRKRGECLECDARG